MKVRGPTSKGIQGKLESLSQPSQGGQAAYLFFELFFFQLKIKMITDWIYSEEFTSLETGFLKWLETLNYSPSTIATRRRNIREFLLYLERCGIEEH